MSRSRLFATLTAAALLACGTAGGPAGGGNGPAGSEAGPTEASPAETSPAETGPAEEAGAEMGEEIPFETIEQRSNPGQVGEQVREVARDAEAWQRVWDDLGGGRGLPEEAPAVDFEERMVIAAAMPTQPCVSRVTIRGIRAEDDGLVVDLLEQPPAEGIVCVVSERPFHAVSLARRGGPVRWEVERRPLDPTVPERAPEG